MAKDRPYGLKLVMGVVQSYMIDSGELPSDHDILSHILQMENWEFEQYMEMKDCTEVRTTLDYINKKLEEQEKEKQARIAGRRKQQEENEVEK